jgi:hypothetical protein
MDNSAPGQSVPGIQEQLHFDSSVVHHHPCVRLPTHCFTEYLAEGAANIVYRVARRPGTTRRL